MCDLVGKRPIAGSQFNLARAQQSLAADGAIACFSSSLIPFSLNADRAPQQGRRYASSSKETYQIACSLY